VGLTVVKEDHMKTLNAFAEPLEPNRLAALAASHPYSAPTLLDTLTLDPIDGPGCDCAACRSTSTMPLPPLEHMNGVLWQLNDDAMPAVTIWHWLNLNTTVNLDNRS
jgi:hypothetical protein